MRLISSAGRLGIAIWIMLACSDRVITAQAPELADLRERLSAILDNGELSELERVRELRQTIDREESALLKQAVMQWVEDLGSREFDARQNAHEQLVQAGEAAISEVARAVAAGKPGDVERTSRCLNVLATIASTEGPAAATALEALRDLAEGESRSRQAGKLHAELIKTDKERALEALAAVGARVSQNEAGDVRSVTAHLGAFTDREMKLLTAFPRMTTLFMTCENVTDRGFRKLNQLPGLQSLYLMKVDDEDLVEIGKLLTLTRLSISASPDLSDQGLASLATLKLRTLRITDSQITDDGIQHLTHMKSLRELDLDSKHITDQGLDRLSELQMLTQLDLEGEHITDQGLAHLSEMASLTDLELASEQLTDQGLEHLKNMSSLTKLGLKSEKLTDQGLGNLSNLTSLTSLYLSSRLITDQGLRHLSDLKNLNYVRLRGTSVSQEGADQLRERLPRIRRIYR